MASSTNTPGPEGTSTPDPSQGPCGDPSLAADDGFSEPPLKRARSSSAMLDDGGEGTPGPGAGGDMVWALVVRCSIALVVTALQLLMVECLALQRAGSSSGVSDDGG